MREEIANNLKKIENALDTACLLLKHGKYSDSVFHRQQAAEKALKTLHLREKREVPFTHNLVKLVRDLRLSKGILKCARELTPDYITTRYVDAANGVPAEMYDGESADLHYGCAEEIVACVRKSSHLKHQLDPVPLRRRHGLTAGARTRRALPPENQRVS